MKKIICIFLFVCLTVVFASCATQNDRVLRTIGKHTEIAFYTHGSFQDYTDYAKYSFSDPKLEDNKYLKKIDDDAKRSFEKHLDNYETFVRNYCLDDIPYDFDRDIITDNDYLYIYDDPDCPELGSYDIWFFDSETNILYYFHTNI